MAQFELKNVENKVVGAVEISDEIVKYPVKPALMHEVVLMQLASRRAGTHATRTRAFVSGGGRKPFRQKGTGRARAGSTRSPLWRGGAVLFGPQPRDYSYGMPKKKVKNALKSALNAKIADGSLVLIDELKVAAAKTKEAVKMLTAFGADRKVLLVVSDLTDNAYLAFRNIPYVDILHVNGLNVYDVVNARHIFITKDCLVRIEEVLGA